MRIVLGHDFDGGAWPGPLAERDAAIGVSWVGPLGFVGLLETALGLSGRYPDNAERTARLAAAVAATDGFWSKSAERDLLGSTSRLLAWRDELRSSGWRGAPTGESRLDALAEVTVDVSPGLPDRLEAIIDSLATRSADIDAVELADPVDSYPVVWRRVFEALRESGVAVSDLAAHPAKATGDLEASKRATFEPNGDHTLQLVRPASITDAAEHVAAWIAAQGVDSKIVVIGSDTVLDRALARFGVPTIGASTPATQSPLLAVLPLVLEHGWSPADPQHAIELLTLRRSPVPASIGWRLVDALARWPAVDSDSWRDKLKHSLDRIEDADERAAASDRIARVFRTVANRGNGYPVAAIVERADLVDEWLASLTPAGRSDVAAIAAARRQVEEVKRLASELGPDIAGEPQLKRLLARATAAAGGTASCDAEAGVNAVNQPGAIVAPADLVVWWDFTDSSVHRHRPILLSPAERAALVSCGVELPDPGAEARQIAARWRRPFEQTTDSLVLVCPRRRPDGDDEFAHPAWDEIVARVPEKARPGITALVVDAPRSRAVPARTKCEPKAVPVPARELGVPAGLVRLRDRESASSLGKLVGCGFAYSVEYWAGISPGCAARVQAPDCALLRGNIAHEIISRVLSRADVRSIRDDGALARAVEDVFDREAPRLAAVFYLAGADQSRTSIREAICKGAIRLLKEIRRRGGAVQTESSHATEALGTTLTGRVDLLLENPLLVVDLKLGGTKYRRDELQTGASYQLAVYSRLLRSGERKFPPAVAYYILADQRWLTTDANAIEGVIPETGPTSAETWRALERAVSEEIAALASGRVTARGCGEDDASELAAGIDEAGRLQLPSPCKFCNFGALCGRSIEVTP